MIGLFYHLSSQVYFGVGEVIPCRPVLRWCFSYISEHFLDSDHNYGSIAFLERCLLPILKVVLSPDEVVLEGCTVFVFLFTPRPTVFRVFARILYKSLGNAGELCFRDRLACLQ